MTAIVIVAQPKHGCIHIATDAAYYTKEQSVVAFSGKVYPVPHWPGALANVGNAAASPLFGWSLAQDRPTFDDVVAISEPNLQAYSTAWHLPSHAEMIVAGLSAERGPEAYAFRTGDMMAPGETEAGPQYEDAPFRLVKLPEWVMTPMANDQVIPANFEGIDVDADPDEVVWSIRKVLEMQRQTQLPEGVGGIGGFGSLTTISAEGIHQRIICRWQEDQIGGPLRAPPIDWDQWHRDNPRPGSRLRREMAERKARKSGLYRVK
jgi:hypothetical protein